MFAITNLLFFRPCQEPDMRIYIVEHHLSYICIASRHSLPISLVLGTSPMEHLEFLFVRHSRCRTPHCACQFCFPFLKCIGGYPRRIRKEDLTTAKRIPTMTTRFCTLKLLCFLGFLFGLLLLHILTFHRIFPRQRARV
jgi:hypothetical protein